MGELLDVIYEDDDLIGANKPAGLVCHPTKGDALSSLISRARLYLGNGARPQLINRLDRETSGVVLISKQDAAARELRRLWETHEVEKQYLAIVHGHVQEDWGVIDAPLGKDEQSRVAVKNCVRLDGAPSRTEYSVERRLWRISGGAGILAGEIARDQNADKDARAPGWAFTLLRVMPLTGRKHQIRIHFAHLGHPVVGDKIYGGEEDLYLALVEDRLTLAQRARLILPNHALHAAAVVFRWRGDKVEFRAEPEAGFSDFLRETSGT